MALTLELERGAPRLDEDLRTLLATGEASTAHAVAPSPVSSRTESLAEARQRRHIVVAARELLAVADYSAVDFHAVAQAAGVRPADVRRHFSSRMELTAATLRLPPGLNSATRARLNGAQMVGRFLAFWEDGDNARILLNVLSAATRDRRVARGIEAGLEEALVRPLAAGLCTPDACPRARLVTSALVGLAVSRYVLREEPLASADHATVAVWMGPSVDCYLRGALGAA